MRSSSRDLNVDTDVSPASLLSQPEQYAEYEDIDDLSAYRYPTTLKRTIDNIYTDTGKHYDEYNDSSESLIGDSVFGPTIATNVATDSGYPPWRVQPPTPSTSVPRRRSSTLISTPLMKNTFHGLLPHFVLLQLQKSSPYSIMSVTTSDFSQMHQPMPSKCSCAN